MRVNVDPNVLCRNKTNEIKFYKKYKMNIKLQLTT